MTKDNQRTCKANPAGENSSFIFRAGVKSVPRYHFKRVYVVLHMAVEKVFQTHSAKKRVTGCFNLKSYF